MEEEIRIELLSKKTLADACKLTLRVFHSDVSEEDYPPKWLKASLDPKKNKSSYIGLDVRGVRYWVALSEKDKVVGIIGLYTLKYDEKEAYWLAWYCVDPKSGGKGIGRALLDFVITKAKKDGKKWFRLYTSDEPNEKRANEMYDKLGFKPIKSKKINKIITSKRFRSFTKDLVYKELKLK
jgi:GNAT superfamily N-acetyltransferase